MNKLIGLAFAVALLGTGVAQAETITFDTAPALGTQAPGVWYKDRYAPAAFEQDSTTFASNNVLRLGISGADQQADSWHNYQGRKLDLPKYTNYLSVDLFLSQAVFDYSNPAYSTFGIWATGVDSNKDITSYPIMAFRGSEFQNFDYINGGYLPLNAYDPGMLNTWVTLSMLLDASSQIVSYFIDGTLLATSDWNGTSYFSNVILQGYNNGNDIDIYLDNLTYSTVPLPAALPLMGSALLGFAGFTTWRRRKSAPKAAAA